MKRLSVVFGEILASCITFLCLSPAMGQSAYFSLEGDLNTVADQHDFLFDLSRSVGSGEDLRFVTYTHSGGTNAAGDVIAASFFDSELHLFDSLDGLRGQDDLSGPGFDALISWTGVQLSGTTLNPDPLLVDNYRLNFGEFNDQIGPWAVDLIGPADAITFTGATPIGTSTVDSLKFGTTGGGTAVYNHSGGTLNLLGQLVVAPSGGATLNLSGGGVVSNAVGNIGVNPSSIGVATVTGAGSQWNNSGDLLVGNTGNGTLNVAAGGVVTNDTGSVGSGTGSIGVATVTDPGSQWISSGSLLIGANGQGTLNIELGGFVSAALGIIGFQENSIGEVTVTGTGSHWDNTGDLKIGLDSQGTLNIYDNGVVTASGTTTINSLSVVNLDGGRFEFGSALHDDLTRVNATAGEMAGLVPVSGVTGVATLTALQNSSVDLNDVAVLNSGLLHGSALLGSALNNQTGGEVRTLAGDWMWFGGTGNFNDGEISNFGGVVEFAQDLTNAASGRIAGRGQFIAGGVWLNNGHIALSSGISDVSGDLTNFTASATIGITVSGNADATFWDDVQNVSGLFHVSSGSSVTFFGLFTGNGITGPGDVFMEADVTPGFSPGTQEFGGNVYFGPLASLEIEIAGLIAGSEYDQVNVADSISLDGTLEVSLLSGFAPTPGDAFEIITAASILGTFAAETLPALPGSLEWFVNYSATSVELISTFAGDFDFDGDVDGNDFLLWQTDPSIGLLSDWETNYGAVASSLTSVSTTVPEPTGLTMGLLAVALLSTCAKKRSALKSR